MSTISQSSSQFLRALSAEQKRLALQAWPYVLGYLLLTAAPYTYVDLCFWEVYGAYVWLGFFAWAITYLLLLVLMKEGGHLTQGKTSGIGTYFALSLVTTMAIGLGLVALILPGLYLIMRWLPVFARALTTEEWITQSMRWSWRGTEHFQKPLSLALLGPVLCYGVSLVASFSYDETSFASYQMAMVIMNLSSSLGAAWLTILGVACFGLLIEAEHPQSEQQQSVNPA